jgi:hypothetical protein
VIRLGFSRVVGVAVTCCAVLTAGAVVSPWAARAESCPNAALRGGPSLRLPDCRAYEMVTPVYKEGYVVYPRATSGDGSRVLGKSLGVFAGAENDDLFQGLNGEFPEGAAYTFTRGQSGWITTAITPPASSYPSSYLPTGPNPQTRERFLGSIIADSTPGLGLESSDREEAGVSPDLSESLWAADTPSQEEANEAGTNGVRLGNFYLRRQGGPIAEVGPIVPPSVTPAEVPREYFLFRAFRASSPGEPVVLYELGATHWPSDATDPEKNSLYEYLGTGNSAPSLVGVSGGLGSSSLISVCGTNFNAASENGSSVLFTASACGSSPTVQELYVRIDNGLADAHTVAVSEPSTGPSGDCVECETAENVRRAATAMGFSSDGSKAFFTTSQPLLGGDSSNNLYEYDFGAGAGHRIIRVSSGDSTVSNPTADVEAVVGNSSDGSHVYFVASGVLTTAKNGLGQQAEAGKSNLYLYERDARYPNGRTEFVLPYTDIAALFLPDGGGGKVPAFRMSQNGDFLTFYSYVHLTPDDLSNGPQAFEYDSQTSAIVRVSIGRDGYNNDGNYTSTEEELHGLYPPVFTPLGLFVADDGAVFFESLDPLVPQAVNGASNVYEYRSGNVYLISDGQDLLGAGIISIAPSGSDVFFRTVDRLVPRDTDAQTDVYDARVDGGFAESPAPTPCEGDACQGSLSGAPVLLSPGSEFQAGGEIASPTVTPKPFATAIAKGKPRVHAKTKKKATKRKRKAGKSRHARKSVVHVGGRP